VLVFDPPSSYIVPSSFVSALPSFVTALQAVFAALQAVFAALPSSVAALPSKYVVVVFHFLWSSTRSSSNLTQSGVVQ